MAENNSRPEGVRPSQGDMFSVVSQESGLCLNQSAEDALRQLTISSEHYDDQFDNFQPCQVSKKSSRKSEETAAISVNSASQQSRENNIILASVDDHDDTYVMMPRGLKNPGNLCFVNATLQALLSCTPFVQLVRELRKHNIQRDEYPTLHAFASFISKFDTPYHRSNGRREPFYASMFKNIVQKFTSDAPTRPPAGRQSQEDAQEFLGFIMDQMHEEFLKLRGSSSIKDNWEMVQNNNKSSEIMSKKFVPSELSEIFWGQEKSIISRNYQVSETVQPFLMLHLDIHPSTVHTIEDSLRLFSAIENLEGYKSSKIICQKKKSSKIRKDYKDNYNASKSVKIEELPDILVLHLMRFSFDTSGLIKLDKPVNFPLDLEIENDILADPSQHQQGRKYELVGSITHHGRKGSMGHYTADVKCPDGRWMHCDDEKVTAVSLSNVLHRRAYILLYKRVQDC